MNNLKNGEFGIVVYKTNDIVSEIKENDIFDRVGSQTIQMVLLSFVISLY